jgi:CheY-like chemotaxis protein
MQPVSDSIVPDTGRKLKADLHPFTLSFQGELEKRFREKYHLDSLATVRLGLLFGFILYGLVGILDALLAPGMTVRLWTIRFAVVAPFFLTALALSYSAVFKMLFQFSMAATMIVAGSALICTTVIVPAANQAHYAGLMLVLMWGYTATRLRFVWAATAGWILVILTQMIAVLVLQNSFAVLLNDTLFLVGSNLVGMFACYLIERYARLNFYQAFVLGKEQEKVKIVNRRLKKIATERTAQLLTKNRELFEETEERQKAEMRYNELATKCRQTQEKEPVGSPAGNAAHHFNHLMTAIQAHISVLLIRTPKDDPAYEKLKQVEQYALQGSSLARQLPGTTHPFEKHQGNTTPPVPAAVENSIVLRASSRRPERPEKADETILFVDDDQMIVDIASNMLMRLGYSVLPATNGREALKIYSREKGDISLVILDLMMPDMSGAQTLDLLKKENPDIKVLLSSGRSPGGEVGQIVGNGCAGFLQKPYDIARLSLKIREALDAF